MSVHDGMRALWPAAKTARGPTDSQSLQSLPAADWRLFAGGSSQKRRNDLIMPPLGQRERCVISESSGERPGSVNAELVMRFVFFCRPQSGHHPSSMHCILFFFSLLCDPPQDLGCEMQWLHAMEAHTECPWHATPHLLTSGLAQWGNGARCHSMHTLARLPAALSPKDRGCRHRMHACEDPPPKTAVRSPPAHGHHHRRRPEKRDVDMRHHQKRMTSSPDTQHPNACFTPTPFCF